MNDKNSPVGANDSAEVECWTADAIVDACLKAGLGILECNSLLMTLKGKAISDAPDRIAYAASGYEDFMDFDSFKRFRARYANLAAQAVAPAESGAAVYPPDGTTSPFTVIHLGVGQVRMADSVYGEHLPALWLGKDDPSMAEEEVFKRDPREGETLAVVTFANVKGLDVLLKAVKHIRREAFPSAPPNAEPTADAELTVEKVVEIADRFEFTDPESGNQQFDRLGFAQAIAQHLRAESVQA